MLSHLRNTISKRVEALRGSLVEGRDSSTIVGNCAGGWRDGEAIPVNFINAINRLVEEVDVHVGGKVRPRERLLAAIEVIVGTVVPSFSVFFVVPVRVARRVEVVTDALEGGAASFEFKVGQNLGGGRAGGGVRAVGKTFLGGETNSNFANDIGFRVVFGPTNNGDTGVAVSLEQTNVVHGIFLDLSARRIAHNHKRKYQGKKNKEILHYSRSGWTKKKKKMHQNV